MAESIENKRSHVSGGGVLSRYRATFRLCEKESKMMFLLRKIKEYCYSFVVTSKSLCHPEFSSGSQDYEMLKQVQHDNKLYLTFRKAFAFTLAETLIVMGIIGVVAALTIPNLNSSTADKEKVAKLKKVYSNLQDAFGRAEAVYGPFDEWFQADTTNSTRSSRFSERMLEFMKTSRNCGHAVNAACMKTGNFTGALGDTISSTAAPVSADNVSAILADGTSIVFSKSTQGNMLGTIYVDIDGPNKGLFRHGVDLFRFYVSPDRGIYYSDSTDLCSSSTPGDDDSCENWVLSNGNLDYLKADSSGKCPNGKILNWTTNTSCK